MKTKEEIQKLSYAYSDKVNMSKDMTSLSIADAVTYGYNQCQQDMDKKYTEEDMGKLWQYVIDGAKSILLGNVVTIGKFEDYINSLNKQD